MLMYVYLNSNRLPQCFVCLQECSVFISGDGITEEIVRKSFGKFGSIQVATVDAIKG